MSRIIALIKPLFFISGFRNLLTRYLYVWIENSTLFFIIDQYSILYRDVNFQVVLWFSWQPTQNFLTLLLLFLRTPLFLGSGKSNTLDSATTNSFNWSLILTIDVRLCCLCPQLSILYHTSYTYSLDGAKQTITLVAELSLAWSPIYDSYRPKQIW